MINLVKIISNSVVSGKRILKFLKYGLSDVRTAPESAPWGIDCNAPKDAIAVYVKTEHNGDDVIIGYINRNQLAEIGGLRLYSENGYMYLRQNGNLELLGNSNFAVKYNELETAFNEVKNDLNTLKNLFSSWVTVPSDGGASLKIITATWSATPLIEQIELSKNDKIKTNG
jgi:hypothetical protein